MSGLVALHSRAASQRAVPDQSGTRPRAVTDLVADLSSPGGTAESSSAVRASSSGRVLGALAREVALVAALVARLGLALSGAVACAVTRSVAASDGAARERTHARGDPPGCTLGGAGTRQMERDGAQGTTNVVAGRSSGLGAGRGKVALCRGRCVFFFFLVFGSGGSSESAGGAGSHGRSFTGLGIEREREGEKGGNVISQPLLRPVGCSLQKNTQEGSARARVQGCSGCRCRQEERQRHDDDSASNRPVLAPLPTDRKSVV